MLYQEYQQKIEKIAKIRKFLFRYRVLFILLIASIMSLTITLMAISGTVTDTSCPTSFMYGEGISYSADAIMNDVYYEYSTDGQTWTTIAPSAIGVYQVRAVSHGLFGSKRTGEPHKFEILPQKIDVSIVENSITYGDIPTVTANLSYEDEIVCTEFEFLTPNQSSSNVIPVKNAITILNKDKEDVTSSYNINVVSSVLTFEKRPITFTVADQTSSYTSYPITGQPYTISNGSLAKDNGFDDSVQATYNASIIDVGSIKHTPDIHIYNKNSEDVSDRYQINIVVGNISVIPRIIKIQTGNYEDYYDGQTHTCTSYKLDNNTPLANSNHKLVISSCASVLDSNVEKVQDNILVFKVLDTANNNTDITSNYNIEVSYGELKVNPRPITIQSATETFVFDNTIHSNKTTKIISPLTLADGDYIEVQPDNTTIKYVTDGTLQNKISCIIRTNEGVANTFNYVINYDFGKLSVSKREITIKSGTKGLEYNGEPQSVKEFTIISENKKANNNEFIYESFTEREIVGTEKNIIKLYVVDEDGINVSDDNYLISYDYGDITITPLPITITTGSAERIYTGEELYSEEISSNVSLPKGQSIKVTSHVSTTYVTFNNLDEVISIDNVLTYTINKGTKDTTANYSITPIYGKLTINKRPLHVKCDDAEFIYNDEDFSNTTYSFVETSLAKYTSGNNKIYESVSINNIKTIKEVSEGTKANAFKLKIENNERETTKNYDITYDLGTLKVYPRPITIKASDKEKDYDAEPLTYNHIDDTLNLAPNHKISDYSVEGSVTDVLESGLKNIVKESSIEIKKGDSKIDISNYNITFLKGTLTINPRAITITTNTKVFDYLDFEQYDTNLDGIITKGSLVDSKYGHHLIVNASQNITKVTDVCKDVENKFSILIQDGSDIDKSANYAIEYVYGKLTVNPRAITVTSYSKDWTYDGIVHTYSVQGEGFKITSGSLLSSATNANCPTHTISKIDSTEIKNVDQSGLKNKITINISNGTKDVTSNYDIDYQNSLAILSISPRPITITTGDAERIYNGEELYSEDISGDNLASGQSIKVTDHTSIKYVQFTDLEVVTYKDNVLEYYIFDGKDDTTSNYLITDVYGKLTINKCPLDVKCENKEFTYNDKAFSNTEYTFINNTSLAKYKSGNNYIFETVTVIDPEKVTEVSDGTKANAFKLKIENNECETTKNYEITYSLGTIKVNARPITIKPKDLVKEYYDGDALKITDSDIEYLKIENEGLVEGHKIQATLLGTTQITNAGSLTIEIDPSSLDIVKENGDLTFTSTKNNYYITIQTGSITIGKRPISIITASDSFLYNALEHFNANFSLAEDSLNFVTGQTLINIESTKVKNVKYIDSIVTYYENDFTSFEIENGDINNYEISITTKGQLFVTPRPITIKAKDKSRVYFGYELKLTNTEFDITNTKTDEGLVVNTTGVIDHTIEVVVGGSIINYGTTDSFIESVTINEGSVDVTQNYAITKDTGTLEITKRTITVTTSTEQKYYDGEPLVGTFDVDKDGVDSGLVTTIDTILPVNTTYPSITDAGQIENKITFIITKKSGTVTDSTINYNIVYANPIGTLTVIRKITISVYNKDTDSSLFEKEYNGTEQSIEDKTSYIITGDGLSSQHIIDVDTLTFTGSLLELGSVDIILDNIKVVDKDDPTIDVTNYYEITKNSGTLKIIPRAIEITTQSQSFVYDGKVHSYYAEEAGYQITKGSLLDGHTLVCTSFTSLTNVKDGPKKNTLEFGMDNLYKDYYDITVKNDGELTIIPKTINVTTPDLNEQYNGLEQYNKDIVINPSTALIDGHSWFIKDTDYTTIQDVEFDLDGNVTFKNNIIKLTIYRTGEEYNSETNDETSNYNFVFIVGKLTLTPITLTFSSNSEEKIYDGEKLVGSMVGSITLADTDDYEIIFTTLDHVGSVDNAITTKNLYRKSDTTIDVSKNYIIDFTPGTLTINPRTINITISNGEWTYDGKEHSNYGYTYESQNDETNSGLINTHTISVKNYATIIDAGEIDNAITFEILDSESNDVTSNYDITTTNAKLIVNKAKLSIKLNNVGFEYSGTQVSSSDATISGLSEGEVVELTTETTEPAIIPGEYQNKIKLVVVRSDSRITTANYELSLIDGVITISKRTITITSNDHHEIDEGTNTYHYDHDYTLSGSIADGQKLICNTLTITRTTETEIENTIDESSIDIVNTNNESESYKDYYIINIVNGKYYFGKRYIEISSGNATAFLDEVPGGVLTCDQYEVNNLHLDTEAGDYVEVVITGSQSEIGTTDNTFTYVIKNGGVELEKDGDSYVKYDVQVTYGKLTLKKRTITITTGSGTWMYDGTAHSNNSLIVDSLEIQAGKTFSCDTPSNSITNIGSITNSIDKNSYAISDLSSEDFEKYYAIVEKFGELVVYARPIIVQSASASKVYDGKELTDSRVDLISNKYLIEEHQIVGTLTATGSNVGKADETTTETNTIDGSGFKVAILSNFSTTTTYYSKDGENYVVETVTSENFSAKVDSGLYVKINDLYFQIFEDGEDYYADVTSIYELVTYEGKLTVYASEDERKQDNDQTYISIISDANGNIYLKTISYGEYVLSGASPFNKATASSTLITIDEHDYSADYIAGLILATKGARLNTATIISYLNDGYPLPYYLSTTGTYNKQTSDALYTGDSNQTYTVGYYAMSLEDLQQILAQGIKLDDSIAIQEQAYYEEVSDPSSQYMQIDDETKAYLEKIIISNNMNASDLSTYQKINKVATYIQSSKTATYDVNYNKNLDNESNVVIAFLDTYKVGVCRHFAAAATMLYRAIGIPARYVIGFVGIGTEAEKANNITLSSYHAWVEVYVQGYGWIQVEVTGGGNIGGYNSTGEKKEITDDALIITVKPEMVEVPYDGKSHSPQNIVITKDGTEISLSALELLGYSFNYTLNGSGTYPNVNYTSSVMTLHINKNGEDITEQCGITYETNVIIITKQEIEITSKDRMWDYDGEAHTPDKYAYEITNGQIADCDVEKITFTSSITEVGTKKSNFDYKVYDKNNNDVTEYYEVSTVQGDLTIRKRYLRFKTSSDSKVYDGTPLTATTWTIEDNIVSGSLLEGHNLIITITGSQTEIGVSQNTVEDGYYIEDSNHVDVTNYYTLEIELGSLEVYTRAIIISTGSAAKEYDGKSLKSADKTTSNTWTYKTKYEGEDSGLKEGHHLVVEMTGETDGANVQKVKNTCTAYVADTSNNPVDGYEIEFAFGDLEIVKKVAFIETGSDSMYYDGKTVFTCEEYNYESNSLVSGDTIYAAVNWAYIQVIPDDAVYEINKTTGVRSYKITNTAEFIVINSNGEDVSNNYNFLPNLYGTLTVIRKMLSISSGSKEKVYDGTPLTLPTEEDSNYSFDDSNLFSGHTAAATLSPSSTITEPGTQTNGYDIVIMDGDEDVTNIYDFKENYGILTVKKRTIFVQTASDEQMYSGKALTNSNYTILNADELTFMEGLGHIIKVEVTGSALKETVPNTAKCYVYMMDGENEVKLDNIYTFVVIEGTLKIILRNITIASLGAEKEYDGTPLTNNSDDNIIITNKACVEKGHTFTYYIDPDASQTVAGSTPNKVIYDIVDENGVSVIDLYEIKENFGNLVVYKRDITIRTASRKSSDLSSILTANSYEITKGSFVDSDNVVIEATGQQYGVGYSYNTLEINCNNLDSYAIKLELGLLTVYTESNPEYYAQIYAKYDGNIILKEKSYGDYTKTSWLDAGDYSQLVDDTYSMNYLPSKLLGGQIENTARVLAISNYTLPYFITTNDTNIQTSDSKNIGNANNEYYINYRVFNPANINSVKGNSLDSYSSLEQSYRQYVYDNYLQVVSSTADAINQAINISSLNPNSPSYYLDIVNVIKSAGINYSQYNTAIDSSSDIIAAFVSYKKGVSKHFASLGTIVFRMLGIPARYCEGAFASVESEEWYTINMSDRISYVEIYVDGFGWLPLDVTPTASQSGEDQPEVKLIPITITPITLEKAYDGTPLNAINTLDETEEVLAALLAKDGYRYEVVITGSQTERGQSASTIEEGSFKLYFYNNEITSKYQVTYNTGILRVTDQQISVNLYEYHEIYNGTAYTYGDRPVAWNFTMPDGFDKTNYLLLFDTSLVSQTIAGSVSYDVLRSCATILELATSYNENLIYYNANNEEVDYNTYAGNKYINATGSFYLTFIGSGLIVEKRSITITSDSASKLYDGSELTCNSYTITVGSKATTDTIYVTITGSQNTIGSSDNMITEVVIKNLANEDVTSSYDITTVNGLLTVE